MRAKVKWLLAVTILSTSVLLLGTGCAPIERAIYRTAETPVQAAAGVDYSGVVGNEEPVVSRDLGAASNAAAAPLLESRKGAEAAIEAVKLLPIPFAGTLGSLLGLAYSAYRNYRNRRTIESLIAGIENARDTHTRGLEVDKHLLGALKVEQNLRGTRQEVNSYLERLTKTKATREQ